VLKLPLVGSPSAAVSKRPIGCSSGGWTADSGPAGDEALGVNSVRARDMKRESRREPRYSRYIRTCWLWQGKDDKTLNYSRMSRREQTHSPPARTQRARHPIEACRFISGDACTRAVPAQWHLKICGDGGAWAARPSVAVGGIKPVGPLEGSSGGATLG